MYLNKIKLPLINEIATDGILEQAYQWICKSSNNVGHNNSVWNLRSNWEKIKEQLKNALRNNTYHLSPLRRYSIAEQTIDCWDAQDVVVLKARNMDLALRKQNAYYVRFMDDWVMLAKTLNHLRKAISQNLLILYIIATFLRLPYFIVSLKFVITHLYVYIVEL